MYLVGFIIRIHHDARSPERQTPLLVLTAVTVNPYGVIGTYGRFRRICFLYIWDWILGRWGGTRSCHASNNLYHNVRRHIPDESTSLPVTYVAPVSHCSQYIRRRMTAAAPSTPFPHNSLSNALTDHPDTAPVH